jgi:hypothetical protein
MMRENHCLSVLQKIGDFAVKNQYFGGDFSLERMTWIKPNFLWMMYRNGWGTKEGRNVCWQSFKTGSFQKIFENSVYSSYNENWEYPGKNGRIR